MNLTIELPDDETVALRDRAKAHGLTPEQYVRQLLERELAPEWLRRSWESARRNGTSSLSMEEIDAEIAAARKSRNAGHADPAA